MSKEKINYVWLVFHYETNKLANLVGRKDDKENTNANIVFKYTTASIKTFITHNPDKVNDIIIYTDDTELIKHNIDKHVGKDLNIINVKNKIDVWKKSDYPWYPKTAFLKDIKSLNTSILFIDNDCICRESIDPLVNKIQNDNCVILWEPEREITNTRPYWGWQKATTYLNRPFSYWVYNDGIIGINKKYIEKDIFEKSHDMCLDVWNNVDITNIRNRPHDYVPKKVFISQQIAICFACQDEGLELVDSRKYFYHYYSNKLECLKYL
jgi:hypothetical protein